jgi:hypothetical protein
MVTSSPFSRLSPRRTPDPIRDRSKTKGRKTGLGVWRFWAMIFAQNETMPRHKKLTDAEIARLFCTEFPAQPLAKDLVAGRATVNKYRRYFNQGRFTLGVVPSILSKRYDLDGNTVDARTGRLLPQ